MLRAHGAIPWLALLVAACSPPTSYDDDRGGPVDFGSTTPGPDTDTTPGPTGTGTGAITTSTDTGIPCAGRDEDGDGVDACADCDDLDPDRAPGLDEVCDGLDNDCDEVLGPDEQLDIDRDGHPDCTSCEAAGYLAATQGLTGDALRDHLAAAVRAQTCDDYDAATLHMFTRLDRDRTGEVEGVYTGRRIAVGNDKPDPDLFNTEHTWPQSRGAGEVPARCDLHHLYPTHTPANSARGSYPFGEVTGSVDWSDGGSQRGRDGGQTVFEPRDRHKGNVARSMLYFSVRYGHTLPAAELDLYQRWHALDPVDDAELARTFNIAREQVLANPFVACPALVERL